MWYHAAATYDGSRMRLYLNGTEVGSNAKSGSLSRGRNVSVNVGRNPGGSNYLRGAIDDVRIYNSTLTQAEITALAGSGPAPSNQPPTVSLTAPESGAVFVAPATITLDATASDPDGSIARVDFYHGQTMIGTDATSPYSIQWSSVGSGTYSLAAVARDNAGATTVSATRDITVRSPNLPNLAVFVPSTNHATAVDHYLLEIFPAGVDPKVANPVASFNLGKPVIANGECRVDITSTIVTLSPGNYVATVTAVGSGGSTQSAPSPQFTR
jgi:Concanavalin A-like lectin/glucanases superfamily/Bacterial Ig domain